MRLTSEGIVFIVTFVGIILGGTFAWRALNDISTADAFHDTALMFTNTGLPYKVEGSRRRNYVAFFALLSVLFWSGSIGYFIYNLR